MVAAAASYTVRRLERADIPALLAIGRRLHAETLYREMDFDEERATAVLCMAADSDDFFAELIVARDGSPAGGLLARLMDTFFGRDLMAHEVLFFVDAPHRPYCMRAFRRLLWHYAAWAVSRGAKRVFLSTASGIAPERTSRVLNAAGFRKVGTVHEAGEAAMGGGGGGGGGQDSSYYYNIMRDKMVADEEKQKAAQAEIAAANEEERKASAAERDRILELVTKKDDESKTLSQVEENKKAIQRANPIPFMTTGYTGIPGADARLLGGSRYTLG